MPALKPDGTNAPGPKQIKKPKPKPKPHPPPKPKPKGAPGAPPKPKPKPKPKKKPTAKTTPAGKKPGGAPGTPKDLKKGSKATLKKKPKTPRERAVLGSKEALKQVRRGPPRPRVKPGPRGEQLMREFDSKRERLIREERQRDAQATTNFLNGVNPGLSRNLKTNVFSGRLAFWQEQYALTLSRLRAQQPGSPGLGWDRARGLENVAAARVNKSFDRDFRAFKDLQKHLEKGETIASQKKKARKDAQEARAHIVRNKLSGYGQFKKQSGSLLTPEDLRILFLDPEFGWMNNKFQASGKMMPANRVKILQDFLISQGHIKVKANGSLAGKNGELTMSSLTFQMRQLRNRERKEAVQELKETFYQTGIIKEGWLEGFGKVGTARQLFNALTKGYNPNVSRLELGEMLMDLGEAARRYADSQALSSIQATAAFQAKRIGIEHIENMVRMQKRMDAIKAEQMSNFSKVMGWLDDRTNDFQDYFGSLNQTMGNFIDKLYGWDTSDPKKWSEVVVSPKEARIIRDEWESRHTVLGMLSNFAFDPLNFVPLGPVFGAMRFGFKAVEKAGLAIEHGTQSRILVFGVAKPLQGHAFAYRAADKAVKKYFENVRKIVGSDEMFGMPIYRPDAYVFKAGQYATREAGKAKMLVRKTLQKNKWAQYGRGIVGAKAMRGVKGGKINPPKIKNNVATLVKGPLKGTKVVDPETSDPLILYQGSKDNFAHTGSGTGHVFHEQTLKGGVKLADESELAVSARRVPEGTLMTDIPQTIRNGVYVQITKPLDTAAFGTPKGFAGEVTRTFNRQASRGRIQVSRQYRQFVKSLSLKSGPKTISEMIEKAPDGFWEDFLNGSNYDGLIFESDNLRSYVVFDETKIVPAFPDAKIADGYMHTPNDEMFDLKGIDPKDRDQAQALFDWLEKNLEYMFPELFEHLRSMRFPLFNSNLSAMSGLGLKFNATMQAIIRAWVIQRKAHDIAASFLDEWIETEEIVRAMKNLPAPSQMEKREMYVNLKEAIMHKAGAYSIGNPPPGLARSIDAEQQYVGALFRDHLMPAIEQRLRREYEDVGGVRPIEVSDGEMAKMLERLGWTVGSEVDKVRMVNPVWRDGHPRTFKTDEMEQMVASEVSRFRNQLEGDYGVRLSQGEKVDPRALELEVEAYREQIGKSWVLEDTWVKGTSDADGTFIRDVNPNESGSMDLWVDTRPHLNVHPMYLQQYIHNLPIEAITSKIPGSLTPQAAIDRLTLSKRMHSNMVRALPPAPKPHTQPVPPELLKPVEVDLSPANINRAINEMFDTGMYGEEELDFLRFAFKSIDGKPAKVQKASEIVSKAKSAGYSEQAAQDLLSRLEGLKPKKMEIGATRPVTDRAPFDDLQREADWVLGEEDNFIKMFHPDDHAAVGKFMQMFKQRSFLQTKIQDEMVALPGVLGLSDTGFLVKNYEHLKAVGPEQIMEFRTKVQELDALTRKIDSYLLPKILARQFAYWQALQEAQSFPLRSLAITAHSMLAIWRFATLPLRPAWTVANVIDNWVKGVIRGHHNNLYFLQATAGGGKKMMTHWDVMVGQGFEEMRVIARFYDKKHGTAVAPILVKLRDSIYEKMGDGMAKLYNHRGIPFSEKAAGAQNISREVRTNRWLTPDEFYMNYLHEEGYVLPGGSANPDPALRDVVFYQSAKNPDKPPEFGFYVDQDAWAAIKADLGFHPDMPLEVKFRTRNDPNFNGYFTAPGNVDFPHGRVQLWLSPKDFKNVVAGKPMTYGKAIGRHNPEKLVKRVHRTLVHEIRHSKQSKWYKDSWIYRKIMDKDPYRGAHPHRHPLKYWNSISERDARHAALTDQFDHTPVVFPVNGQGRALGTSGEAWTVNPIEYAIQHGAPSWDQVDAAIRYKAEFKKIHDNIWELLGNKPEMFFRRWIYKAEYMRVKKAGATDYDAVIAGYKAMEDTLFDYSKITLLEQNLFFLAPFVQFFRKNTTFWIKNSVRLPLIPGSVITFENNMAQVHGDADPKLQRYLTSGEISDALDRVPGLGWLAKFAGDHNFMLDPLQLFSFAPLWRAFKSENPYLDPDDAGLPFLGSLVDALADWGLMMNPFLRKPLEMAGVLNARAWQSMFPQTSVIQALTRHFLNSRFPDGINIEEWLMDNTFNRISKAGVQDAADNFNYYVQLEMAAQAHRGETVSRERATKKVTDFVYANTLVGYFFHIYSRRNEPSDFFYGQIAEKMKYGVLDFNDLPPDVRSAYYLFKNRDWDPVAYDKYVKMLPLIQGYYKVNNWQAAQDYLAEHPEIFAWVKKGYKGTDEAADYIKLQMLGSETEEFMNLQDVFKKVGVPYDIKNKINAAFITPELDEFWAKNDTPHEKKMRMLQGKVAHYYTKLTKTFHSLPDGDAKEAFALKHPDLERWWALNDKDSDDLNVIYRAVQQTVRDRLFEYYEKKDFDGALKWINSHPYVFDHTQSESKYRKIARTGQWPGWKDYGSGSGRYGYDHGGGYARSQHAIDYLKARSALDKYFSLSQSQRSAWLSRDGKLQDMVRWYFDKYASDSNKPLSAKAKAYLNAKKHLDFYFSLTKDQRRKWLNGNSKGAKIVRNYFRKFVDKDPASQSARAKDYENAKVALNYYFSLPEEQRYAWLHGGSKLAQEALAYFSKYSKPKEQTEHSKDFTAVKDLLDQYFKLPLDQRAAFTANHPELKAYFDKYAVQGGMTEHAEDFLAVKAQLDYYFSLSKEARRVWIQSGTPDANAVLNYFKKYSKQQQYERKFNDSFSQYQQGRYLARRNRYRPRSSRPSFSVSPAVNKRLEFWRQYFALTPDLRPAFVMEHGEEYGIFIFGVTGDEFVDDEMQEWIQGSYAHGSNTERSALYSLVAPLLDFYFTIEDPSERDMFRRLNPDLDHYLREFVWDSITGDPVFDKVLQEYFSLPRGSRVRSDFLAEHPELQEYFELHSEEADTAIQELLEQYFSYPPGAERKQYAAEHPEIREYFDQIKAERDAFNEQLAVFDEADPRFRETRDKARAEIEYDAWLKKYLTALAKFQKLVPRGLEQRGRSGRRPLEEGEEIRERSEWLGAGVG